MSRSSKFLTIAIVLVILLACSSVSQPVQEAQQLAATAQALGSAIPEATLKALGTSLPDLGQLFNPQGTPAQEWKGVPIMPQATAGQEFPESNSYSFKAKVTIKEIQDFYTAKLTALGWKQASEAAAEGDAGFMAFQKDKATLLITITASEDSSVIILAMIQQ